MNLTNKFLPNKQIFILASHRIKALDYEVETENNRFRIFEKGTLLKSHFAMEGWYKTDNKDISMHDDEVQKTVKRIIEDE